MAQEGRIFLSKGGRERDHSERQERVRDLYLHELSQRDGHCATRTGPPTSESHVVDPQHCARLCANGTTQTQTKTLPCLPPSMQEDPPYTLGTAHPCHEPHFQNFTNLVPPVLHHPHLHHHTQQVRPHMHTSCDIVPCPHCDGRKDRRKKDKEVVDREGLGSAGESKAEEAELCEAQGSMTRVRVHQQLSSSCVTHSLEQGSGNVPHSPPVEEQPDASVAADSSRQDIALLSNESSVPVTQAAVRYPSPSVLARCKKRKLPEAQLSSIRTESQSEREYGELNDESSQSLSLTFSSDFDKTATPGRRNGVMNSPQREAELSHESHLQTNESFEDGGPTQSSVGPVVCHVSGALGRVSIFLFAPVNHLVRKRSMS